jgi:ABC-type branched-subunit amino acid transport system substrate-binding protein
MPRVRTIAVAAAALALLAGCSAPAATPAPTPEPTETLEPSGDGILKIGTLFPTSGNFSFIGAAQVDGVALAVKELNDAGGVNGAPVELVQKDSGDASTTAAETAMSELVTAGVDVVIGPSSSVLAQRLLPTVVASGIPMISPAATLPDLTGLDDQGLVFRTIPAYQLQGYALADALAGTKVALVVLDDADGGLLADTLMMGLDGNGGDLTVIPFPAATTDWAALAQQVVAAAPDSVVVATPGNAADQNKALLPALVAAGYGGAKLWLTSQNTADYSQAIAAGTLDGANAVLEAYVGGDDWNNRLKSVDSALAAFRYGAEAYDATMLAALAAMTAGDDGAATITAGLQQASRGGVKCVSLAECTEVLKTQHDIDYDGVSGPLTLDGAGDVAPAYYGLYTYNGENKYSFARGVVAG